METKRDTSKCTGNALVCQLCWIFLLCYWLIVMQVATAWRWFKISSPNLAVRHHISNFWHEIWLSTKFNSHSVLSEIYSGIDRAASLRQHGFLVPRHHLVEPISRPMKKFTCLIKLCLTSDADMQLYRMRSRGLLLSTDIHGLTEWWSKLAGTRIYTSFSNSARYVIYRSLTLKDTSSSHVPNISSQSPGLL